MANPGNGGNALEVHSQTLPSMPRQPHAEAPPSSARTSVTPPRNPSRFARVETQGASAPQGYSRRLRVAAAAALASPERDG